MATVTVITNNNVEIEYEVAGIGDRVLATLVDWVIYLMYYGFIALLVANTPLHNHFSTTLGIVFYLPVFFYHLLCEMFLEGQSIGKKALGIKVVMLDAGRPAFVNYLLRWIMTPLEFGFGFGIIALITCAANGRGQRLGDMLANTTVIRLKPRATFKETVQVRTFPPDYAMQFKEVSALTDKDMNLIRQVQQQIKRKNYEDAFYFADRAKEVICNKLNIVSEMDSLLFIDTIVSDYQYYASTRK